MSYKNLFEIDITEEDIIAAFDDEQWEENVAEAAFLGAVYTANQLNVDPKQLINEIINYNINKKIKEIFLQKTKPLPKKITFENNIDLAEAFCIFENFISYALLLKDLDKLTDPLKLQIVTDKWQQKVCNWCNKFQEKYSNEIVITHVIKNNNTYITVKNI